MISSRTATLVFLLAVLALRGYDVEGARGGSRGSYSRSTRSSSSSRSTRSSSSSSRSSSTRSSSYRTSSSGAYRGRVASGVSYTTVTTRTTVISTRYSRSYSSGRIGSVYWGYYSLYYYQAGLYSRRTYYSSGSTLCENYEANMNQTAIGWFQCPFPFEPNSYTACCGDQYAEFCCEPDYYSGSLATGAIVGIVLILLIVIILIVVCCYKRPYRGHVVTVSDTVTTTTTVHHSATNSNPAFVTDEYNKSYMTTPQPPPAYSMNISGGYPPQPPPAYGMDVSGEQPPQPPYMQPQYPPPAQPDPYMSPPPPPPQQHPPVAPVYPGYTNMQ